MLLREAASPLIATTPEGYANEKLVYSRLAKTITASSFRFNTDVCRGKGITLTVWCMRLKTTMGAEKNTDCAS